MAPQSVSVRPGGFIGRRPQLTHFEQNLDLGADDPARRSLFVVHGNGGVGKTSLTKQFRLLAQERGYLTGYADEDDFDVPGMLEAIAQDFLRQGVKCKTLSQLLTNYRDRWEQLLADPDLSEDVVSHFAKGSVRVAAELARQIPLIGPLTALANPETMATKADRLTSELAKKIRNRNTAELIINPDRELTRAFLHDLGGLTRNRPIALFLDTFERTGSHLEPWLLTLRKGSYGTLPANVIITITGRKPLDANRWSDHLHERVDFPLEVFSEQEARQLLAEQGVVDPAVVDTIMTESGRLPIWLATLAASRPSSVAEVADPSVEAVDRFLKWETDERRRDTALRGALPRRLDRDIFAAAAGTATPAEDFAWLQTQSFLLTGREGFRYHDEVRAAMLRVQRRVSKQEWQRDHRRLAEHFGQAIDALGLPDSDRRWTNPDYSPLAVEQLYHRMCAEGEAALQHALGGLSGCIAYRPELASRYIQAVERAGLDAAVPALADRGAELRELAERSQDENLALLAALATDRRLRLRDRAVARAQRGAILRDENRLDEALSDLTLAVALDDQYGWAYGQKASVLHYQRRFDEALTDHDRCIRLMPASPWPLARRALTNLELGKYREVVEDCDAALILFAEYPMARALRAAARGQLGETSLALQDFLVVAELRPKYSWARFGQAELLAELGRFTEAIEAFTAGLEANPGSTRGLLGRAYAQVRRGDLAAALADVELLNPVEDHRQVHLPAPVDRERRAVDALRQDLADERSPAQALALAMDALRDSHQRTV
ncbi:hypothetical protein D5S17_26345 [Pseudonocardiaceae bacterium YIM PH 21723]|nr:hypothetical protein D5S17_26345 [Pseudonocardiaceae bacterium YIM PH 21723]